MRAIVFVEGPSVEVFVGFVEDRKMPEGMDDRVILQEAYLISKWEAVGLASLLRQPIQKNVKIEKLGFTVNIPVSNENFRIEVGDDWGISK